jgi:3-(3-hydroxy-phenyl)propionate hydroxylase
VTDYDVIISGYGPVGQVAANLLGQRGYRVAVFETATSIYNLPRAAHFDAEVMRIFQAIGLAEEVMPACAPIRGMHSISANGEKLFRFDVPEGVGPNGWQASFMFYQPDLEAALQRGVKRFPNVEVYQGHEVLVVHSSKGSRSQPDMGEDGIRVSVRDLASGAERTVSARYLWGCDGARSLTRKAAGIELEDLGFDQPWLVVDTLLKRDVLDLPDVCHQVCDPARPVTYVPSAGSHRRWEFMLMPGEDPAEMERAESVHRLLAPWVTPDDAEIIRAVVYSFHALIANGYRRGPIFILGDAAHQMPPFLGQGMCAGIRDARNLVWKLDLVRAGIASDALLDTYFPERAPHVRAIITRAVAAGRIIQATDPAVAEARDRMFLAAEKRDFTVGDEGSGIEMKMPGIAAGVLDPCPAEGSPVGQLFPQAVSADGRRTDDLLGPGFALVAGADDHTLDANVLAAWECLSPAIVRITSADDPGGHLSAWLDANGVTVVRPDRYVYGVARCEEDLIRLAEALRGQLSGAYHTISTW